MPFISDPWYEEGEVLEREYGSAGCEVDEGGD